MSSEARTAIVATADRPAATAALSAWARALLEWLFDEQPGVAPAPTVDARLAELELGPAMWRLAGERAWLDPELATASAARVRRWLRARAPGAGEAAWAHPVPECWWLLLDLLGRPHDALGEVARAAYRADAWAGFREQWWLAAVLARLGLEIRELPVPTAALLRDLPLMRDRRHRALSRALAERAAGAAAPLHVSPGERALERPMWYRSTGEDDHV